MEESRHSLEMSEVSVEVPDESKQDPFGGNPPELKAQA